MKHSARTITGLTAIATVFAAAAFPAQADQTAPRAGAPQMRVRLADLDLTRPDDVATLYARIRSAAQIVCRDSSSPWDAKRIEYIATCFDAVVDDAVARIDQPLLTALHAEGAAPVRVGAATP